MRHFTGCIAIPALAAKSALFCQIVATFAFQHEDSNEGSRIMSNLAKKLAMLGIVGAVIVVALLCIESKVAERSSRRDQVVEQIAAEFAGAQELVGPLVMIEFPDKPGYNRDKEKVLERVPPLFVRPGKLDVAGSVAAEQRYRGLFRARTFEAALTLDGEFVFPDLSERPFTRARLVFAVADARGIRELQLTDDAGQALVVKPGGSVEEMPGINVQSELDRRLIVPARPWKFHGGLKIAGSGALAVAPVAEANTIELKSSWPHPSFIGEFLPASRNIDASGFAAKWQVNDLATGGQDMLPRFHAPSQVKARGASHPAEVFGARPLAAVALLDPVDPYALSDRAVRYGFLFVLITLATVLLFEVLQGARIHPMQYLLAGLAVTVFFMLLFSLSEHFNFALSYAAAGLACAILLGYYGAYMLESKVRGLVFGVGVACLYGLMYVLLTLEDTALLVGAVAQFLALAIAMVLTRRLNWYSVGDNEPSRTAT